MIISKFHLENIYNFIIDGNILELIEYETVFEEFLIQTLNVYLNNKMTFVICQKLGLKNDPIPTIVTLMKDKSNYICLIKINGKQLNNCNSSRSSGLERLYDFFNKKKI